MSERKDDIVSEAEEIIEEALDEAQAHDTDDSGSATNSGASDAADSTEQADENAESEAEEVAEPSLEDLVVAAKEQAQEWQDKFMRLHAEWDTYRRRTNEAREDEKARAAEGLVGDLLPVLDDFERSINYAEENGETGLLEGVKQVHTKLIEVLTKGGVEVIDPAGEAFDALEAQAVAKVDDASVPDETVAEVYQKGYRMGKKVLRPAMVTVTTGGPAREVEEQDTEGADVDKADG